MIEIKTKARSYCWIDDIDSDLAAYKWHFSGRYAANVQYDASGQQIRFLQHRVIVERMIGRPLNSCEQVDHINGNKHDNRRCNLRPCTRSQNATNYSRRNRTGYRGVTQVHPRAKFVAQINIHGETVYLGRFDTAEEAHAAYCEAGRKYFGEFFRAT